MSTIFVTTVKPHRPPPPLWPNGFPAEPANCVTIHRMDETLEFAQLSVVLAFGSRANFATKFTFAVLKRACDFVADLQFFQSATQNLESVGSLSCSAYFH